MNDRSYRRTLLLHYAKFLAAGLLWTLSLWLYGLSMALLALDAGKNPFPWRAAVVWLPAALGTFVASKPGRRPLGLRLLASFLVTGVVLTVSGLGASLVAVVLSSAPASSRTSGLRAGLWLDMVQMSAAVLVRGACYPAGGMWLLEALAALAVILIPALVAAPALVAPAGVVVWLVMAWGVAPDPPAGPGPSGEAPLPHGAGHG